jgi:ABC-type multidrug transport system ATPase subunit
MADSDLLLLDEPTSNLDPKAKEWYKELLLDFAGNRSILVGSNFLEEEFFFAQNSIELKDFQ